MKEYACVECGREKVHQFQWHCAECHETFSSKEVFLFHREDNGGCWPSKDKRFLRVFRKVSKSKELTWCFK